MNFLELAFAEDLEPLSKASGILAADLADHQGDIKEITKLWARVYPDQQRNKVDQRIWDRIESIDIPRDTALLGARDIINRRLEGEFKVWNIAEIDDNRECLIPELKYSNPLAELWMDVLWEFGLPSSYRLCAECKKPFPHASPKAVYCSEACRSAAYRRRKGVL